MPICFFKPKVNESVLSNSLNLFTCMSGGRKAQNLVIDCHGYHKPKKLGLLSQPDIATVPPGAMLYFYSPHGSTLFANLIVAMEGGYEPLEVYMPGQKVANYRLYPFSGKWGDASFIKRAISQDRITSGKKAKRLPLREFDVLQPRLEMRLERLISILQWENQLYPRIHCLFCRQSSHRLVERLYNPAIETPPNTHQSKVGRWQII